MSDTCLSQTVIENSVELQRAIENKTL